MIVQFVDSLSHLIGEARSLESDREELPRPVPWKHLRISYFLPLVPLIFLRPMLGETQNVDPRVIWSYTISIILEGQP